MSEMVTDAGGQLINAIAEAVSAKLLKLLDTKQRLLDVEAAGEKLATYYAAQKAALEKKNVQSGRKNVQSILEGRKRTG
jgi:hypothetical protein